MRSPKLPIPSEHAIQSNFFREANYEFRNDPTWVPQLFYAVLHGAWIAGDGRRKAALIAKYKEEGWKPGISDVHYDQPRGAYNKLIIEFKRSDRRNVENGGLSDEQLEYCNQAALYAKVVVCYSEDEAMVALREYMELEENRDTGAAGNAYMLKRFHDQFNHDRESCEICLDSVKEIVPLKDKPRHCGHRATEMVKLPNGEVRCGVCGQLRGRG